MNKQTETALKMVTDILDDELWFPNKYPDEAIPVCFIEALKACKEALEQPAQEYLTRAQQVIRANNSAQEPVAWIKEVELGYMKSNIAIGKMDYRTNLGLKPEPDDVPLYTHPAPSWQGLSDNKIISLYAFYGSDTEEAMLEFARAIEQALKEKNS